MKVARGFIGFRWWTLGTRWRPGRLRDDRFERGDGAVEARCKETL
jgi:hypothetical protein